MSTTIATADFIKAAGLSTASKERSIYKIIDAQKANMGRLPLARVFEGEYQNYVSPFYIVDEFGPLKMEPHAPFRIDAHPHAGIIPTTYLLEGAAHHRDSMDNDFQYHKGDFIHFTAGKGALHMEETGKDLYDNGGVFHGFQGWLNIPSRLKKSEPYSGHFKDGEIGKIKTDDFTIKVISGEVFGVQSSAKMLFPVLYFHITMNANATLELPVDKKMNAFIYLIDGQLKVGNERPVGKSQAVLYERNGDFIKIKSILPSNFVVLGGEPNNEPYVASGPFVLNSTEEISQAYRDFQAGKFGDLNKVNRG